jgi:hypothetical protein
LINDGGNDNDLNEAPRAKAPARRDKGVLQALDNNQVELDLEIDDENNACLITRSISKNGNNKLNIAMQHYEQKKRLV